MKPAYHISLTAKEKRLIAELAAIQSQIEWLMRLTVQFILGISPTAAQTLMGSTNFDANTSIWIAVVREKHPKEEGRLWAEYAYSQMKNLAKGRNDFLHTLFGFATEDIHDTSDKRTEFFYGHETNAKHMDQPRRAIRVKGLAESPLADLEKIRDNAAYLSVVCAHVESLVNPFLTWRAPWPRRLGSKLPPQPLKTKPKKKGRNDHVS